MKDTAGEEKESDKIRAEILNLSVCEEIYSEKDFTKRAQLQAGYRDRARKAKCLREFDSILKNYSKQLKVLSIHPEAKTTHFEGQKLELDTGDWDADDYGIVAMIDGATVYACPHALMPIERQIDVDTGAEKILLSFKEPLTTVWKTRAFDRSILSDSRKIVGPLSSVGVSVTSETARFLVKYIYDLLRLNDIPRTNTVSRLGWVSGGGRSFIPYSECDVKFSGDLAFESSFKSVVEHGAFDLWKDTVLKAREKSIVSRAALNASFASVLVEPLGKLPFFVHIWGPSGTGKTVALMLAMSVWGNPDAGALVKSLSGTTVGLERMAAFFNSIPLALDELQTRDDRRRKSNEIVYVLSGGQGKPRGTRSGGIERLPTWRNFVLTTGEQPLVEDNADAGAINRVLSFYQDGPIFEDAPAVADTIKANYGHAGRLFALGIAQPEIQKQMHRDYDQFYRHFLMLNKSSTEKQAMAAAMLAMGEYYADLFVFGMSEDEALDEVVNFADKIYPSLSSAQDVDDTAKGYDWIVGWAAANSAKFNLNADSFMECWGEPDGAGGYFIIAQVLQKALSDAGISCRKVLQGLAGRNKIENREEAGKTVFSIKHSVGGARPRCIHLYGDGYDSGRDIDDESLL